MLLKEALINDYARYFKMSSGTIEITINSIQIILEYLQSMLRLIHNLLCRKQTCSFSWH